MLSKKIFFLIDIDWTKEAWRGHLPSYHGYFIDSLLQNGNQVISISPNPKLVQEQLASMQLRSFAKLTLLSFSELKEKIYAPPLFDTVCKNAAINEASIKTSLSRRIKNRLKPFIPMRFLKKYHKVVNSIEYQEKLRFKNIVIQFAEFDKFIQYCIQQMQLDPKVLVIIFPFIDQYLFPRRFSSKFDSALNFPWYCLWVQTQNINASTTKEDISFFDCPNCKGLLTLEENKIQILQRCFPDKKILFLPDIVKTTQINRNFALHSVINQMASGRKIIGLIGRICESKGILTFLEASIRANQENNDKYFFVIIGGGLLNKPETFKKLGAASEADNVLIFMSNINSDKDFNAVFNQCDIIYSAYHDFPWSSNTISKASYYKKPVIVSKGYLIEQRVKRYGIGVAIEQSDATQVLNAIHAIENKKDLHDQPLKLDFDSYNKDFSWLNFQKTIQLLSI